LKSGQIRIREPLGSAKRRAAHGARLFAGGDDSEPFGLCTATGASR